MSNFPAQYVVYAYMYISVGLLVFNLLYANSASGRAKLHAARVKRWHRLLRRYMAEWEDLQSLAKNDPHSTPLSSPTPKVSKRRLSNIHQLTAFSDALERLVQQGVDRKKLLAWLYTKATIFRELIFHYGKRNAMERAYYAWFLSQYDLIDSKDLIMLRALNDYLEDSTVYCRENVLKAMYRSGNAQAVEHAFENLSVQEKPHSRKLIADGLLTFRGDQRELAWILWRHYKQWDVELVAAVVQFITRMKPNAMEFAETFLAAVKDEQLDIELRAVILRYFSRYPYEPMRQTLIDYVLENHQEVLAIIAATVLAQYPGRDSIDALRKAVCSPAWYIRTNAATSLIQLTRDCPDRDELLKCDDRYGKESIEYCLEQKNKIAKNRRL